MNKQQLLVEKKKIYTNYQDYWGFLDHCKKLPGQVNASGNGMLYMSQAMILFKELGIADTSDNVHFFNTVYTVKVEGIGCYGIFHRHPLLKDRLEEHDNQMGMVVAAYILGFEKGRWLLEDVYRFGQNHKRFGFYFYNNLEPEKLTMQTLRQGCYRAVIDWCSNKRIPKHKPRAIDLLWLLGNIYFAASAKHKEGNVNSGVRLMAWTMLQGIKDKSEFWKNVEHWYTKKAKINEMANIYYGDTPWATLFNEYYRRKYNA